MPKWFKPHTTIKLAIKRKDNYLRLPEGFIEYKNKINRSTPFQKITQHLFYQRFSFPYQYE